MAKSAKDREKDGDMSKIEARERQLRVIFEQHGGLNGKSMQAVLWFFSSYHDKPRPDLMKGVLDHVTKLQLMSLPEHRHGVAGALTAVLSLLPEEAVAALRKTHKQVVESAERLALPTEDVIDLRPGHMDYLWMQWVVLRQELLLNRLVRLASVHVRHDVREQGMLLLRMHTNYPEVAQRLEAIQALLMSAQMSQLGAQAPTAQVNALGRLLVEKAGSIAIILVGWVAGEEGGFVVVTADGSTPTGCPATWDQRPVRVRKATEDELAKHRAIISVKDEP